ncbi:hypothetical protein IAT38_003298 [Cryptococcus sp. DSM 104549]
MSRFAGRRLDQLWFWFFIMHIPTTLLIDLQALYPPSIVPAPLSSFANWSIELTRDPVLGGVFSKDPSFGWLKCFMGVEGFFQLPVFVLGAWGLWHNDKRIYPLIIAYGASTATTVIPCIHTILTATPSPLFSTGELANLLAEYVPFFAIPLAMAVDMGVRVLGIIGEAQARKTV